MMVPSAGKALNLAPSLPRVLTTGGGGHVHGHAEQKHGAQLSSTLLEQPSRRAQKGERKQRVGKEPGQSQQ